MSPTTHLMALDVPVEEPSTASTADCENNILTP